MKLFKKVLAGVAVAATLAVSAAPVPTLPGGPLYIKFDNREQIATVGDTGYADEINWGVLTVSTINAGTVTGLNTIETTGAPIFTNLMDGGQITGIFYGIEALPSGTGGNAFPATSGFMDLYYRDTVALGSVTDLATSAPGIRTAQNQATGFTDGTFLTRLAFASGINEFSALVYINGSSIPSNGGFAGLATSFANVDTSVSGLWNEKLDTDWFSTPYGTRDLRFRNIYESLNAWNGDTTGCSPNATAGSCILGARSTDPATAYAIPEPGSLALLGLGLLGLVASRRRSKA